ncbi:hypothetical protein LCGC14_2374420 [marine sediment metagenome]|uniref:HTH luxR-type domain-containing protein n=1 Tax=marine sediment metagenome TaxID=412755 RepID=A0A0F9C2V3_9ZZZZ
MCGLNTAILAPINSSNKRPSLVSLVSRESGRNGNGWWLTIRSARPATASAALAGVIVRQGIKLLVSQEKDMVVCAEADSADGALEAIERSKPHVATVDLSLKDSSGLELIKDMRIRHPEVLALVLSMRDETFYAERVLRAGARGYITKEEGTERVIEGIRAVDAGQIYVSQRVSSRLLSGFATSQSADGVRSVGRLTDRELEVFEMIGAGLTTREIAERLHLSVKTIDSHREHIKDKLQIANATELLKHAIHWTQGQDDR